MSYRSPDRRDDRDRRDDDRYDERRRAARESPRDDRRRDDYDDRRRSPPRERSRGRDEYRGRSRSRSPQVKRISRDADGNPKPAPPSTCVGVFGLHRETTSKEFEYQMQKFGRVAHTVLVWNHRERCNKGFGFITYENLDDAATAVKEMNGRTLDGRTVRVDFSFSKVGNKEHMYDSEGKRKAEYCDPNYKPPRYDRSPPRRYRSRSRDRYERRSRDRYERRSRDRYERRSYDRRSRSR